MRSDLKQCPKTSFLAINIPASWRVSVWIRQKALGVRVEGKEEMTKRQEERSANKGLCQFSDIFPFCLIFSN